MKKIKLDLIFERGPGDELTGRVTYNDNLIVDQANSVQELEENMKRLLQDFEDVHPETVDFVRFHDVYALFDDFEFLKITSIAKHAGINPGLLRQYASGVKHPSARQAKKIEETIHRLADGMRRAHVYAE